ncbi:RNA/RNP complex-1-interacting phosphatase isoform 3 [Schistosoma japonicum]|uniref:RNA/RNP complex-1-interacting phosphatase isoform 3 n=1 Tax=Schistosoma japonicum TaxID=6182 RepID=A0A4Z2CZY7_SCHJA|nr:RNA/RNP complex-1-interacting phosphatase isoform 3 [Schistosoma japonicum]TNN09835.1 RNA/RNP complex-1-interacting phosphatase isoform 3 [Schistosoma japonicum]
MPCYPPDRWIDYAPLGVPVKGTRFLPIKLPIPLEKSYNIPPHLRFTLSDLIECVHSCNQKLTCVIDLTYAKYYSSKFLHDNNIRYYKIYVEGHKVPDSKSVAQFIDLVNKERKESPDGIIAVHCTHGVNRTGYFICRYLIDSMNVNPKDALQEFEYARGYPVERENYIKDLLSFVRKSNVISVEKNKRN